MALFLAVHARYKDVQLGLFKDGTLIDVASDESKKISKNFISMVDHMLKKNRLTFAQLMFIAAHQGPAPFTTLRVCLTTVNGFAFATGIPLIGVNGLQELVEHYKQHNQITIALLNAFSNDVYYGIDDPFNKQTFYGYAAAESLIKELATKYGSACFFVGNGNSMYKNTILAAFGDRAHFLNDDIISIESIAKKAIEKWRLKQTHSQLMPIYLKEYSTPTKPVG